MPDKKMCAPVCEYKNLDALMRDLRSLQLDIFPNSVFSVIQSKLNWSTVQLVFCALVVIQQQQPILTTILNFSTTKTVILRSWEFNLKSAEEFNII